MYQTTKQNNQIRFLGLEYNDSRRKYFIEKETKGKPLW